MRKVFLVFSISLLLLLISCGESPKDYNVRALAAADSIISSADLNFTSFL
jgi:hypothetical protein